MSATSIDAPRTASAAGGGLYLAFVPWILFAAVAHRDTLLAGSLVALAAAVLIAGRSLIAGGVRLPEVVAVVSFAGFSVVALLVDTATAEEISRYARAIAASLLAVMAFGSLLFTPFTEQYARASVPRELWTSPRFKAVNRELTTTWGIAFALMVPSHLLAGAIDTQRADTLLNWLVPVALIVWAAKRTSQVTENAG